MRELSCDMDYCVDYSQIQVDRQIERACQIECQIFLLFYLIFKHSTNRLNSPIKPYDESNSPSK